ncbi:MAG: S9 family peptidase [Candidatus Peribacteria bacterium]|nr:S9 family peptidase [Candidatus Peribacteria bacterium]
MGASGGGGRALVCAGRYPDFFTSVYAAASVSSLTRWYTIETNPQINSDRDTMRRRT